MQSRKEALNIVQNGYIADRRQANRRAVTYLILSHALAVLVAFSAGGLLLYPIGKDHGRVASEQDRRTGLVYGHRAG